MDPGRVDLGLNLKQNGRYQLLEYSRLDTQQIGCTLARVLQTRGGLEGES